MNSRQKITKSIKTLFTTKNMKNEYLLKKKIINLNIKTLFDDICRDRKKTSRQHDLQIYVQPDFVVLSDNRLER